MQRISIEVSAKRGNILKQIFWNSFKGREGVPLFETEHLAEFFRASFLTAIMLTMFCGLPWPQGDSTTEGV
jgi:hypothetical protein